MTDPAPRVLERIRRHHHRATFRCGEPALDEFLRRYARQNERKDIGRTYVATLPGDARVLGYFTIRAGAVAADDLPVEERRALPAYPVPVVHLARLAVDEGARGRRLGEWLLVQALRKALAVSGDIGIRAVEVHAKSDPARAFYERYGFRSLPADRRHLYLSIGSIRRAFSA
jgi:ribosomal protein S18 acetylase RimI-like enzyme